MKKTGIEYHPGRQQPFTVWRDGKVIKFCTLLYEAEAALTAGQKDKSKTICLFKDA